jgi:hypothetical protein
MNRPPIRNRSLRHAAAAATAVVANVPISRYMPAYASSNQDAQVYTVAAGPRR